jgi:[acyl-carrier-protein] S-malonyltransferase
MKKLMLFFPGQGSQYVGMGENLFQQDSDLFLRANQSLNFDLKKIMLEGPAEELTKTANTQPAIFTHSMAIFTKLTKFLEGLPHVSIQGVMGHSVGEYSALCAAGVFSFEDGVKIVNLRGKHMQNAVPVGEGSMYAILKVPATVIEEACDAVSTDESQVMPANYNSTQQIVISGHKEACSLAVQWLKDNYTSPFRAIELTVSAPFHSSLMAPATENLAKDFESIVFHPNNFPYIANIDAALYAVDTAPTTISQNLLKQVEGSVKWSQGLQLVDEDCLCLEIGPGSVLKGLAKKVNPNLKFISLDKMEDFDELRAELTLGE